MWKHSALSIQVPELSSSTNNVSLTYTRFMRIRNVGFALVVLSGISLAQSSSTFAPLEQWKTAVLSGDAAQVKALYSAFPAAQIDTISGTIDASADAAFWAGLKIKKIDVKVIQSTTPQPGMQKLLFQAEAKTPARTVYITAGQLWQLQNGVWTIVAARRDLAKLEQPLTMDNKIYPVADARTEIRDAEQQAAKGHKRVIVVFGADWCYDCHVLDKAFHRPDIVSILSPNYEVVHVDVGQGDKNQDLMNEYGVPMKRGIPAIAVLDSSGKLLYSQKNGEWERARALGPEDLVALLNKWKPTR